MNAATDAVGLKQLRARLDELGHRRLAALERLAPDLGTLTHRRLEAMRFELSELEWHLADLDAILRG